MLTDYRFALSESQWRDRTGFAPVSSRPAELFGYYRLGRRTLEAMSPDQPRDRVDACPGALTLHQAADGPLARIRLPGGILSPPQLDVLARAATDLGNGAIELTVRGNVQLRAVSDSVALADRLIEAGLLPSPTHERVRNIVASPLSGRIGGLVDIRELVHELDRMLLNVAELAALPGRVLFSIDDGRGDVSGLGADFGLHAVSAETFALILGGADTGSRVDVGAGVTHLAAAAQAFVRIRGSQWRLHEVPDGAARILSHLDVTASAAPVGFEPDVAPPIGWLPQDDGQVALGAGVRFGTLDARTAEFLAAVDRPLVITPWRTIVLTDLDDWMAEQVVRVLAPMGLIFDSESPWLSVTACTGRPGCAKSLADIRGDAAEAVEADSLPVLGRQHWSGCERR